MQPMAIARAPIPVVVQQHADDAAMLRNTRSHLVGAPHVRLHQLRRLDERIAGHLDGLAVAGEYGSKLALAALESPGPGEAFTATVRAIEDRDGARLDKLITLSEALPASRTGVLSAFGWVSAASLRGITSALLQSPDACRREIGLAACAMHQVDAGPVAEAALDDAEPALRARALRVVSERGQVRLLPACLQALGSEDVGCHFEAARAAVLLGDRRAAIAALDQLGATPGPWRATALELTLKLHGAPAARDILKSLAQDPRTVRLLIRAVGVAGDPHYVPWLVEQMHDPQRTRIAGESFSLITGLDLALLGLDLRTPEEMNLGPTDDPEDGDVSMDADDSLPWPDPEKIGAWWLASGHRFAAGARYFMGEHPSPAHCLSVLKSGFQRQRKAAAVHLCLLNPGTPLFNTAAPAWRQERWLNGIAR